MPSPKYMIVLALFAVAAWMVWSRFVVKFAA